MKRLTFAGLSALLTGALLIVLSGLSATPPAAQDATQPPPTAAPLPTQMPRPNPSLTTTQGNATLQLYFQTLPQGSTGLMRVSANNGAGIANVRARFLDGLIDFYPADDGLYGFLSAGMEQPTSKNNELDVFVTYADGTRDTFVTPVEITLGAFIRQNVTLGGDKTYLLDIETERNELAQLESVFSNFTEQKMWDSTGFQLPIFSALTSPFGAFRTFNGSLNTRHTGWDLTAAMGVPVLASASGKVVFSAPMAIRGNHVDHRSRLRRLHDLLAFLGRPRHARRNRHQRAGYRRSRQYRAHQRTPFPLGSRGQRQFRRRRAVPRNVETVAGS